MAVSTRPSLSLVFHVAPVDYYLISQPTSPLLSVTVIENRDAFYYPSARAGATWNGVSFPIVPAY